MTACATACWVDVGIAVGSGVEVAVAVAVCVGEGEGVYVGLRTLATANEIPAVGVG
jgi:hypothetical protein